MLTTDWMKTLDNQKHSSTLYVVIASSLALLLTCIVGTAMGQVVPPVVPPGSMCPMMSAGPPTDPAQLTAAEVDQLVRAAAMAASNPAMVVAVVDRGGTPLGVFSGPSAANGDVETALSLARTGAFFGNMGSPLTSRTVGFISANNFPPDIPNQPAGALYGIQNTNRGCPLNATFQPDHYVPPAMNLTCTGPGLGMARVPGGLPVYRNGALVIGGIGVAGFQDPNTAEYAAFVAVENSFWIAQPLPFPGNVYLNGFLLPLVIQKTPPAGVVPASSANGSYLLGPFSGMGEPEGWIVGPNAGAMLSVVDVQNITQNAVNQALNTRSNIRLPLNSPTRMVIAISDLNGTLLGLFRMIDATVFSIDVAVAKARNAIYFSGPGYIDLPGVVPPVAVTNRTVGFGSQLFFPSGITGTPPGPFFQLFLFDTDHPCTQGSQPVSVQPGGPPNGNQNGIVFFPGSAPLYSNGRLVGGLGVSGDGVDQDDYVTSGGAAGYLAPAAIRADQQFIRNTRLPYWKFPRNPNLQR